MVIAQELLEGDLLDEELEDLGDYIDKESMAEELNWPRDWERKSWDEIFTGLVRHRAETGGDVPTRPAPRDYSFTVQNPRGVQAPPLPTDGTLAVPKAVPTSAPAIAITTQVTHENNNQQMVPVPLSTMAHVEEFEPHPGPIFDTMDD